MRVLEWVLWVIAAIVWVAGMVVFFREGVGPSLPFMAATAVLLLLTAAIHGRRERLRGGPSADGSSLFDWLPWW